MPATDSTELLDVERRFWDAMKTKDAPARSEMTDDGCIVVGAQGVVGDRLRRRWGR